MKPIKSHAPKNVADRVAEIEKMLPAVISATNQALSQAHARIAALHEVLEAVVEQVGPEAVASAIDARRERQANEQAEKAKEWVTQSLQSGVIEAVDTIADGDVVVGVERDSDGKPLPPGRTQLTTDRFLPEVRDQLIGKGPGATIETAGTSFEVQEAYRLKAPAAPKDQSEAGA